MEALVFMCWACVFHIVAHLALLLSPLLLSRQTEGTILRIEPFDEKSFLLTVNYPAEDSYFRRRYVRWPPLRSVFLRKAMSMRLMPRR